MVLFFSFHFVIPRFSEEQLATISFLGKNKWGFVFLTGDGRISGSLDWWTTHTHTHKDTHTHTHTHTHTQAAKMEVDAYAALECKLHVAVN